MNTEYDDIITLFPGDTGLLYAVWVGEVDGYLGPIIKVSNIKGKFSFVDNFVMSVSSNPEVLSGDMRILLEELQQVRLWIELNYQSLMKLWDMYEMGNGNMISLLQQFEKVT